MKTKYLFECYTSDMVGHFGSWVHLSVKDTDELLPIMTDLSKRYLNGDVFTPHISVMSSRKMNLEKAKQAVDECSKGVKKFEVIKDNIKYSDKWSKTLYIQLKNSKELIKLSRCLDPVFRPDQGPYPLDPHISLLYKEGVPAEEKSRLSRDLQVPDTFTAVSLALVSPGKDKEDWRDFTQWEIVYERKFF